MAEATNRFVDRFDRFTIVSVTRIQLPIDWTQFNKEHAALVEALRARDKRAAL
ncbi:hypothetical protein [Bradyrhizobium frederickii]|uniref:hypothetical protein n=1 Tax=Bradyrhizobium frederickii TaxID=2560054 RepID=UPI001F38B888|nr:hypothetical protein [Bradyrhizobium frederickii]